jgi:hypothetical protein
LGPYRNLPPPEGWGRQCPKIRPWFGLQVFVVIQSRAHQGLGIAQLVAMDYHLLCQNLKLPICQDGYPIVARRHVPIKNPRNEEGAAKRFGVTRSKLLGQWWERGGTDTILFPVKMAPTCSGLSTRRERWGESRNLESEADVPTGCRG